jgi:deoxyribose-phosphate aldolase
LNSVPLTPSRVAKMIDHSLLRPELPPSEIVAGCALAVRYGVASVSVKPCDVSLAAHSVAGTGVAVGTVIGFPHGASTPGVKAAEARTALADGADELDMVLNIGRLRGNDDEAVSADIRAVVAEADTRDVGVKVILETAYLTDEEKRRACGLAERAGASFVKTSTGFAPGGATPEDVRLLRASVSPRMNVKAAGAIRGLDEALALIAAGANRLGTSATAVIVDELTRRTRNASR